MEITHKHVCNPDNPVDGDGWNDKHDITPLLYGYELVEEIVAPAGSTSILFDELNLETDGDYLIDINATLSPSSSISYLKCVLNDDLLTVVEGVEHITISDNAGHEYAAMAYLCCGRAVTVETTKLISKGYLTKLAGEYSYFNAVSDVYGATYVSQEKHNGVFRSLNNVTTVTLTPTTGTLQGTFRLWKRIKPEVI